MLSNRDSIRSLKLADVTMPETFLCKIVKFLYSIASDVFKCHHRNTPKLKIVSTAIALALYSYYSLYFGCTPCDLNSYVSTEDTP